jgi:hypothetical protein
MEFRSLNPANLVVFKDYLDGSPYERFQRLTLLTGSSATLTFKGWNLQATGVARGLSGTVYKLLVDGVERASTTVASGAVKGDFVLPLAELAEGWHVLDIEGTASESTPQWFAYVQKGSAPVAQSTMPVAMGTFQLVLTKQDIHQYAFVPSRFQPIQAPLPARDFPEFSEALPRTALVQSNLVPWRPFDLHRTIRSTSGILNTFNKQSYFFDSMTAKHPDVTMLDGPRGVGTVGMATHLQMGRAGKVYFCDSWRFGRIDADGAVTTLAGYRHQSPPRHSTSISTLPGDVELVGDWSAIPVERRGFHEIWGMAWDARTLVTNEAAAPIPSNGTLEKPHVVGPTAFISDTQNNRICKVEFNAASRTVPAKVSEFITGLGDPWDIVYGDGLLYVSERSSHRVAAYDAITGAFVRTVVQGAALATVDSKRVAKLHTGVSLTVARAEPCVSPEGLFLQDGWLYFGSTAQQQVRRVHLSSGVVEVAASPQFDSNSRFVKIALSDGTFYPRGTVFSCNWGVFAYGRPQGLNVGFNSAGFGPGLPWETLGYPSAVAVGQGRMVCASSSEGIVIISKALPTDAVITETRWKAAVNDYQSRGFLLSHGPGGWGYFGLGLPWGVSAEIDFYLSAYGHVR